jgi:hypothetical protein
MSNWSVVSVGFSGLEHRTAADVEKTLSESEDGRERMWIVVPPVDYGDAAPGNAVEWLMSTHVNHFDPRGYVAALRELDWEYPGDVCIMWKSEHMQIYRVEIVYPEHQDEGDGREIF